MASGYWEAQRQRAKALFNIRSDEAPAVAAGAAMFFLLFTGYFMLRPVRETMGIAGGVENLQWLFTATFIATLIALPIFGWIASKVVRRRILPWTYAFFATNLFAFAFAFTQDPQNVWIARTFYVWLSVFNLLVISLAWSVLADIFAASQAKRLFAMIAAGASLGGLTGPVLGTLLVEPIGHAGLMFLSAILLTASAAPAVWLHLWRDPRPLPQEQQAPRAAALGGHPLAGATAVLASRYLAGIAFFVVLLAVVNTFLYFEQAKLVAETFPDRVRQTQVFGIIDTTVQTLTILIQILITGRIAERFGIASLLVAVPLVMAAGFLWLALAPVFAVLVVVMIVRRVGEYALVRPGREMLYTVVPPEEKYKAKSFIDTVVYRGGDAAGGWVKRGLDVIAEQPWLAMVIGSGIALVWAGMGLFLGRRQREREAQTENDETTLEADAARG